MMKTCLYIIAIVGFITVLSSCSNFQRHDDALRIKDEAAKKYYRHPTEEFMRDGSTLHGTVVKVQVTSIPDSCPVTPETHFTKKTSVVFLDHKAKAKPENFEIIPIEDVQLISDLFDMPRNDYNNINIFENFNSPDEMRPAREVPVDTIEIDTCCPCNCVPWELSLALDLNLKCVERNFKWYFLEVRGAYAMYSDFYSLTDERGRDSYPFEIAAGVRLGENKEWGVGAAFTTGIKTYNSFKSLDYTRPVIMLHGRWQSSKDKFMGLCMRPFLYGQFGFSIDKLSMSLMDFNFNTGCDNCKKYLKGLENNGQLPGVDFSVPLSFGIGAGIDIPIVEDLDLSFDLGFRSIAFGEAVAIAGFDNVPSNRRVNMMIMRFGFTL